MSKITLDPATADLLKKAEPGTELTGPDGKTVGAVFPADLLPTVRMLIQERQRAIDEAFSPESIEELNAIEAEGGDIPHEEVMKRLGLA